MTSFRTVALAATALLLVACTSGGTPSAAPVSIAGGTFVSTGVQGHGLVAGTSVRLSFTAGQVGINAGCNSMSGAYRIVDGRLVTTNMASTEMGCTAPLMDQDRWIGAFIGGAMLTVAGDTLTLRNGDTTMTLKDNAVAAPDRPLEGTRWVVDGVVDGIVAGDTVSTVPQGVTATITIAKGRIDIQTGCNGGSGAAEIKDGHLAIGPIVLTKMACAGGTVALERAVTGVLSGDVAYTIQAGVLTLTADPTVHSLGPATGLTLRAAD